MYGARRMLAQAPSVVGHRAPAHGAIVLAWGSAAPKKMPVKRLRKNCTSGADVALQHTTSNTTCKQREGRVMNAASYVSGARLDRQGHGNNPQLRDEIALRLNQL